MNKENHVTPAHSIAADGNAAASAPTVLLGACYASFAYDAARSIDLNDAARRIVGAERDMIRHRRRAPQSFQFEPLPLRVAQTITPLTVADWSCAPIVEVLLYDFGAICVSYQFPLHGPLDALARLSDALYDNAALLADSRRRVEEMLHTIGPAAARPNVAPLVEDYVIFCLDRLQPHDPARLLADQRPALARILHGEIAPLAEQEIAETLACRFSYTSDDLALVDWHAAILIGPQDDLRTLLEFVNTELLEMRFLDAELDRALEASYRILSAQRGPRRFAIRGFDADVRRIARLQAEGAMLFEGVDNALKLIGDQFVARVYRGASERMHLPEWDAAILRKLNSLESIYAKLSDESARRRMEVLEWIIILLILLSIALPFLVAGAAH